MANSSIKKTYGKSMIKVLDFLEVASLGDLLIFLNYSPPKIKRKIVPSEWRYKQMKVILNSLSTLRNKASHSSLKLIDDHIYKLPDLEKSLTGNLTNKKEQYIWIIEKILVHLGTKIRKFNI